MSVEKSPALPCHIGRRILAPLFLFSSLLLVPVGCLAEPESGCRRFTAIPERLEIRSRYIGGESDPNHEDIDADRLSAERSARLGIELPLSYILKSSDAIDSATSSIEIDRKSRCFKEQLTSLALNHSMEDIKTSEAAFYRDWVVASLSIAYINALRKAGPRVQSPEANAWLKRLIAQIRAKQEVRLKSTRINNHFYWGGLALMSAGTAVNDNSAKADGLAALRVGISQIDNFGMLPTELERGKRALHYHVFAAAPLVALALLSGSGDEPLSKLHSVVRNIVQSLTDLSQGPIAKRTGIAQIPIEGRGNLFILKQVAAGDPELRASLDRVTSADRNYARYLGGRQDFWSKFARRESEIR